MSENTKNEIESIGEFGLIDELTREFKLTNDSSVKGIGDDCAVISSEGEHCFLPTCWLKVFILICPTCH
jgi:thiamine-monophosphate kinase